MRLLVASVVLLAGCDLVFLDERGTCYGLYGELGGGLLEACVPDTLPERLDTGGDLDTGRDCTRVETQSDSERTEVCVIGARTINIQGALRVFGPRPLALVATEVMLIGGELDASSKRAVGGGPGASFAPCVGMAGLVDGNGGGGGGAGGSFASRGGDGGRGDAAAGLANPPSSYGAVRGGCAGGAGGDSSSDEKGGPGGEGGGGLYLIAGTELIVTGTINASGQGGGGGEGGSRYGAGGGGGSGGLIGFDSPVITISSTAKLVANGGGGGGGADPDNGANGGEANPAGAPPFPADGGIGGTPSAFGGAGADRAREATAGGASDAGGGGGGGRGVIVMYGSSITVDGAAALSPAPDLP